MNTPHPWRRLFLCLAISIIATWQTQTTMLNMLTRYFTSDDKTATLYAAMFLGTVEANNTVVDATPIYDRADAIEHQLRTNSGHTVCKNKQKV